MIRLFATNFPFLLIPAGMWYVMGLGGAVSPINEPILIACLVALCLEAAKASRVGVEAIMDALIGVLLFIIALVVLVTQHPYFDNPTWRMITYFALADVLISIPVMINVARRDFGIGGALST